MVVWEELVIAPVPLQAIPPYNPFQEEVGSNVVISEGGSMANQSDYSLSREVIDLKDQIKKLQRDLKKKKENLANKKK